MAYKVAGELYESITGQLFEIGRQLRQPNGYPFDPQLLKATLQAAIEGKFDPNASSSEDLGGLLKLVGDPIQVSAYERFVTHTFACKSGTLPILQLGRKFNERLLGVIEENVPARALRQQELLHESRDGPVLAALGGNDRAKVSLAHVYEFLQTADRGFEYTFYVEARGQLWSVASSWMSSGWNIGANEIMTVNPMKAGCRIVSC